MTTSYPTLNFNLGEDIDMLRQSVAKFCRDEIAHRASDIDRTNEFPIDLWKKFGRGNEVGNMLYGLYSAKEKPKINYPAVKIKKKPTPAEEAKLPKNNGPCP